MRRWKSMEITTEEWKVIRPFLKANKVKFEASECYGNVHVEAYVTESETHMVNGFIDRMEV